MNNEIKDINKKIRFLNDVISLNELFKPKNKQHIGGAYYQEKHLEMSIRKHKVKFPLGTDKIKFFSQFRFFGDNTQEIKRTVKKDEIISIFVIESGTENKFPFSTTKFKEMTSKIIFI